MTENKKPAALIAHEEFLDLHAACPFSGQGGSYVVENGKRRLVERTGLDEKGVADANAAADTARATAASKE